MIIIVKDFYGYLYCICNASMLILDHELNSAPPTVMGNLFLYLVEGGVIKGWGEYESI